MLSKGILVNMKDSRSKVVFSAVCLWLCLFVSPASAGPIVATDFENQSGTLFAILNVPGQGDTISYLIGKYGASAPVFQVVGSVLSTLGGSTLSSYFQQNLADFTAELLVASPAAQSAVLGDFASASGILISDSSVVPISGPWGAGFTGMLSGGEYGFGYAVDSGELIGGGAVRTPNRDYSYLMSGGLIQVNVEVTTHYYGFGYAYLPANPVGEIPEPGTFALGGCGFALTVVARGLFRRLRRAGVGVAQAGQ
jgi:hypothetical protein